MTDSQKLDLLLDKMGGMEVRMDSLENKMDSLESRMGSTELRIEKMEGDLAALRNGQTQIRKDIKNISDKLEDTYQLALDA